MILNIQDKPIPSGAVYIGRKSKWGNPFVMYKESDRDTVIAKYNVWLKQMVRDGKYSLEELASLHGKDLVCHCAPKGCHGYSLAKVASWAFKKLIAADRERF